MEARVGIERTATSILIHRSLVPPYCVTPSITPATCRNPATRERSVSATQQLILRAIPYSISYIYGDSPDSGATASPSQSEINVTLEFNLRIRNAIVDQKNSDGNNDARDLHDFRAILNYNFRW